MTQRTQQALEPDNQVECNLNIIVPETVGNTYREPQNQRTLEPENQCNINTRKHSQTENQRTQEPWEPEEPL